MVQSFQKIMEHLKKGSYANVYFLQGEEVYYIDAIVASIEKYGLALDQTKLNFRTYYGKEHGLQEVLGRARCVPMFCTRQVIIVKEAQEMRELATVRGQNMLMSYMKRSNSTTLLLFAYKYKAVKSKTFLEAFKTPCHVLLTTPRVYDSHIPAFVQKYVRHKGYKIAPQAVVSLQGLLGNHLQLLVNELEKVMVHVAQGEEITNDLVVQYVGFYRAFNPFELQQSIADKDVDKAFRVVNYLNGNLKKFPIIPIVGLLTTFFLKILKLHYLSSMHARKKATTLQVHPFFIRDYERAVKQQSIEALISHLKALHNADRQLKGIVGYAKPDEVLKELVARLLNFG